MVRHGTIGSRRSRYARVRSCMLRLCPINLASDLTLELCSLPSRSGRSFSSCGTMVQVRRFMIDNEKLQKGRGWAYLAGVVIFVAVVAWKFATR
jgi:hypothetical protein